jgi:chlorobactene glucosyltransferase
MPSIIHIYHIAVLLILGAILATVFANVYVIPILREQKPPGAQPYVSVLIPARNEEHRILLCLESLLNQNYSNFEILVLDDRSEDNTSKVVRNLGGKNVRLIAGKPLPSGWIGKSWACHQLAELARGDLLLFTDADTIHSPGTISAVVRRQLETDADLLTVWPFQITRTWSEKLVIPLLYVVASGFLVHWLLVWSQRASWILRLIPPDSMRALGVANGQFLLFRRTCYEQIGGHETVRDHLVEDVALGREVAARAVDGYKLITCNGTRLVQCRMYRSLGEMWEGFTKNLWPVFDGNTLGFVVAILLQTCLMVLPFFLVVVSPTMEPIAEIGLIYLIRVVTAIRFRTSWLSVILHPIGYLLALSIALNSLQRTNGPGVTWKGRVYKGRAKS